MPSHGSLAHAGNPRCIHPSPTPSRTASLGGEAVNQQKEKQIKNQRDVFINEERTKKSAKGKISKE
jgi:hypothetical protein